MNDKKIYRLPGQLVILSILLLFTTMGLGLASVVSPIGIRRILISIAKITGFLWIPVLVLAILLNVMNKQEIEEDIIAKDAKEEEDEEIT